MLCADDGAFEGETLVLFTVARGLVTRIEAFALDAVDAALARLAELRPDPLRIPDVAKARFEALSAETV